LAELAEAAGTDASAVALAWLLHHPAKVMPVMGSVDVSRIQKFADAEKVPMDRQTWFELYELANGCEVP
jgi:predicted oxidoreductase